MWKLELKKDSRIKCVSYLIKSIFLLILIIIVIIAFFGFAKRFDCLPDELYFFTENQSFLLNFRKKNAMAIDINSYETSISL